MAQTARFVRGSQVFDLDGVYALTNFVPPPINPAYNIATGTSANQTGGGQLVGAVQQDRELTFGVRILGSSEMQIENAARRLAAFLAAGGDTLYFEYKASDRPDPLYGQFDAPLRYEVITCQTWFERAYRDAPARAAGLVVGVDLTIKPLALGARQKVMTATGGVIMDVLGTEDGQARGVILPEATTNKMTNPVFGHATYSNGWTAGTGVIVAQNTDLEYVYPGAVNSARVTGIGTAANTFTQSINAGTTSTHTLSAWVVRPDRGTVTSSQAGLWYGSAPSTTYTHIGNGVYRLSASVTGINSATNTGVTVVNGYSVYVLGAQLEEKAFSTPLAWGDLLGCAWTGTEHASTSTRTVAEIEITRTDDILSTAQGAVELVWQPQVASTMSTSAVLFGGHASGYGTSSIRGFFEAADDKFYIQDGTNSVSSAAQTFSAFDTHRLIFTWGPSGLTMYRNGTSLASGTAFTPPGTANSALLTVGQAGGVNLCNGLIQGFTVFDRQLTATQAAALDAAIEPVVSASQCVDHIPWLWTKDGDNIVDNWDSAAAENWCVVSGVAGNEEASAYWRGTASASGGHSTYFSRLEMPYDKFIKPDFLSYVGPGTASVTGSDTVIGSVQFNTQEFKLLEGRNLLPMVFASDAGTSTLNLRTWVSADAGYYYSAYEPVSFIGTAGSSIDSAPALNLFANDAGLDVFDITRTASVYVYGKRTAGTANFIVKFLQIFPAPYMVLKTDQDSAGENGFVIHENGAYGIFNSLLSFRYEVIGSTLNLIPGQYNAVMALQGEEQAAETGAEVLAYTAVYIEPRWGLI